MVGIGHAPPETGPQRGDIFFVNLPDVGGHVMKGPHPVLIVRSDALRRSTTVNVLPMASTARSMAQQPPYLVPVTSRESGLNRDGFVRCDQTLTVPATVFARRAGRLSPGALDRVDAALRFLLAL
jgi:mRNA-degrading endonuclease toxin of MazEF toxin-antitoxin module